VRMVSPSLFAPEPGSRGVGEATRRRAAEERSSAFASQRCARTPVRRLRLDGGQWSAQGQVPPVLHASPTYAVRASSHMRIRDSRRRLHRQQTHGAPITRNFTIPVAGAQGGGTSRAFEAVPREGVSSLPHALLEAQPYSGALCHACWTGGGGLHSGFRCACSTHRTGSRGPRGPGDGHLGA